nr:hypothetical protein [Tanacetum cinerariifolium]
MMGNVKLGRSVHGYAVKGEFGKEMKLGNTLCDTYSKCGDMDAAMQVFENRDERSVVSWTSMVAGYADIYSKCGDMDAAMQVFENMDERSVVSWTSMVAGYAEKVNLMR